MLEILAIFSDSRLPGDGGMVMRLTGGIVK